MHTRRVLLGAAALLVPACATAPLSDHADLIEDYTPALARQIDPRPAPYAAVFRSQGSLLVYVAARHESDPDSVTQALVRSVFARWPPRAVIFEGFDAAEGPSSALLSQRLAGNSNWARSEAALTARLGLAAGVPCWGGEPTQHQLNESLLAEGYTPQDIFCVLLLRSAAYLVRSGGLSGAADAGFTTFFRRTLETERTNLSLPPDYDVDDFYAWYLAEFSVAFGEDAPLTQRASPGDDTRVGRLFQRMNVGRNGSVYHLILRLMAEHRRVLTVYGASHLTSHIRALTATFGRPEIV